MLFDTVLEYNDEQKNMFRQLRETILQTLATQHDPKKMLSFLNKTGVIWIDEKEKSVIFGVPNEFILTQVKKFFQKPFRDAVVNLYNPQFTARVVVYPWFATNHHDLLVDIKKLLNLKETKKTESQEIKKSINHELWDHFGILFEPVFRFENFVVWANNNIAFSAAKSVAEAPWESYNPLFLYGTVWLGKTHLMQAIWNEIMDRYPDKVVVYLPTTKLIDDIVSAVRSNKLSALQNKLEQVDVLLVDDIQFLANKEKTQEIFHNIFNDFQMKKKQIILSSDRPPKELINIEPRLKSRFTLGLVADIQIPDFETRIAILQSKLYAKGEDIDFNLLEIIAKYVKDNVRELEWILNIILTRKKIMNTEVSEPDIFNALKTLWYKLEEDTRLPEAQAQVYTKSVSNFTGLVEYVAKYYNIWVSELKSDSRRKEITNARQLLMLLAKKYFNRTLEKIWDFFGWKGHAAVIYAINNTEKKIKSDKDLAHDYQVFADWLEKC